MGHNAGLEELRNSPVKVSVVTDERYRPDHWGDLDFAFLVHPRTVRDVWHTYPELWGRPAAEVMEELRHIDTHVISSIDVGWEGRRFHGELVGIPYLPEELIRDPHGARSALREVLRYCGYRGARMVGLGALLPSLTRAGSMLANEFHAPGITTGHGYTALAIAWHVAGVSCVLGLDSPSVAVVGAAGSTGRAAIRCMNRLGEQNLILVDRPEKHALLQRFAGELDGNVRIGTDLSALRQARIVVCVTNSVRALIQADMLSEGCVVIDDAQPENVSRQVAEERPDVTVLKCLAHVPGLNFPFDMEFFPKSLREQTREYTYTCLAETILLSAAGCRDHFSIGDPTLSQLIQLEELADRWNVGIAPFHSFPSVGMVDLGDS